MARGNWQLASAGTAACGNVSAIILLQLTRKVARCDDANTQATALGNAHKVHARYDRATTDPACKKEEKACWCHKMHKSRSKIHSEKQQLQHRPKHVIPGRL